MGSTCEIVVVVDFYFASQGQTGNGAQFYGSEFQKGESYGEREREGGGGREMISNFAASTERTQRVHKRTSTQRRVNDVVCGREKSDRAFIARCRGWRQA